MKRSPIILLVFLLLSVHVCAAQSNSARRDRLQSEIAVLNSQMKTLEGKNADATAKLNILNEQIERRKALLAESDREVASYDRQIRSKEQQIRKSQAELDTLKSQFSKLVKVAYKNRDARIWYLYLLSSGNLGQAAGRYNYLRSLSGQMNSRMEQISAATEVLVAQKEELASLRAGAKKIRDSRASELSSLQTDQAAARKLVNQIKSNKQKVQSQIAAKKKQMDALNKAIADAVAKQQTSSSSVKGKKTSSSVNSDASSGKSSDFNKMKGKLPWPVDGVIVEQFGQHYHPVYKNVKLPYNNGVNIATAAAAPVSAIYAGVVKQVIVMPGYNQCVLVQHGGYYTFYCKLRTVSVKAGDKVKAGQQIGVVDTISGETQLHFELWQGRKPQNPENWCVK